MQVKLIPLAPNFHKVDIENKSFWFSYETIVAFSVNGELVCSENVWSLTTGKHLTELEPDVRNRVNFIDFKERLNNL